MQRIRTDVDITEEYRSRVELNVTNGEKYLVERMNYIKGKWRSSRLEKFDTYAEAIKYYTDEVNKIIH